MVLFRCLRRGGCFWKGWFIPLSQTKCSSSASRTEMAIQFWSSCTSTKTNSFWMRLVSASEVFKHPQRQRTSATNPLKIVLSNIQEGHVYECLQVMRQKHWSLLVISLKWKKTNYMFSLDIYFNNLLKLKSLVARIMHWHCASLQSTDTLDVLCHISAAQVKWYSSNDWGI